MNRTFTIAALLLLTLGFCKTSLAQNSYIFASSEKGLYKKAYYTNEIFFDKKYGPIEGENICPVGTFYKTIDLKKAKTDTLGLSKIQLKNPDVSYGLITSKGVFMVPPVYSAYLKISNYTSILGRKLRNGNWQLKQIYHSEYRTDISDFPENTNYWYLGDLMFLFKGLNGKYGVYDYAGKLVNEAVYDSVEYLNVNNEKIDKPWYNSFEECYNGNCKNYEKDPYYEKDYKNSCLFVKLSNKDSSLLINTMPHAGKTYFRNATIYPLSAKVDGKNCNYFIVEHGVNKSNVVSPFCYERDIVANGGATYLVQIEAKKKAKADEEARYAEADRKMMEDKKLKEQIEANPDNFTQFIKGSYKLKKFEDGRIDYYPYSGNEAMYISTKSLNRVELYINVYCNNQVTNSVYTFKTTMILDISKSGNIIYLKKPEDLVQNFQYFSGSYDVNTRIVTITFQYALKNGVTGYIDMSATRDL